MKALVIGGMLLLGVCAAQAQNEYVIEGKVKGLKDGTAFTLFRQDGRVGQSIARDTVRNETFRFKEKVAGEGIDKLSLYCMSKGFPSISLELYATPNAKIKITGADNLLYTWKVDSPVKEQQELNLYVEAARDLWDSYQKIVVSQDSCQTIVESDKATVTEKEAARAKEAALDKVRGDISLKIKGREIAVMKRAPMTSVGLDKLYGLSLGVRYRKSFPYSQDVKELYAGMTDQQKASVEGQNVAVNLFPPDVLKEGDAMVDADLYDLEGKIHHLADFKGRHILLDFWSSGCGPCIMSFPELKEIHEQYGDRLAVVSLNSDSEKTWKAASVRHPITWHNLNDLKQMAGLYARLGINGIPHYVFINPEGKILKMWSGYGKGSLKQKMRRWLDIPQPEMSITREEGVKAVNYPVCQSGNTEVLEVKQVLLVDTATIVRMKVYFIPKYWIQLSLNSHLIGADGTKYTLKKAEGITLGEQIFMPDSGEIEFTLCFAPLPGDAKSFDFTEGGGNGSWRLNGIRLE